MNQVSDLKNVLNRVVTDRSYGNDHVDYGVFNRSFDE